MNKKPVAKKKTPRKERCYCLHLLKPHYAGAKGCQFTATWRDRG